MDTRTSRARLLRRGAALAGSSLVALGLLWFGVRAIQAHRDVPLEVRFGQAPDPRRSAPVEGLAAVPGERLDPRTPEEWAFHMDEKQAASFFAYKAGLAEYDPWCFSRRTPDFDMTMNWPEHPAGRIRIRTNSLGLREDHELSDPPADLRVLVVGDSHANGVCENGESFSNLLEAELARRLGRSTEVLNAASGGHSFINYFGSWLRFRDFRPQVVVVAVYGGNDFCEMMGPFLWFTGRRWPPANDARTAQRLKAFEIAPHLMGQGLDHVGSVRTLGPLMAEMARTGAWLIGEMQRSVRARGAELVVAYIPSPYEVGPVGLRLLERRVCLETRLTPADFTAAAALCQSFLDALDAEGVRVVDLRPPLRAEKRPPYWDKDLHLDLRGHAIAADALLPVVEELLR